jgi:hypothetical protein
LGEKSRTSLGGGLGGGNYCGDYVVSLIQQHHNCKPRKKIERF